jgi:hypothetical protein
MKAIVLFAIVLAATALRSPVLELENNSEVRLVSDSAQELGSDAACMSDLMQLIALGTTIAENVESFIAGDITVLGALIGDFKNAITVALKMPTDCLSNKNLKAEDVTAACTADLTTVA